MTEETYKNWYENLIKLLDRVIPKEYIVEAQKELDDANNQTVVLKYSISIERMLEEINDLKEYVFVLESALTHHTAENEQLEVKISELSGMLDRIKEIVKSTSG